MFYAGFPVFFWFYLSVEIEHVFKEIDASFLDSFDRLPEKRCRYFENIQEVRL